jgi:hypothetical protein
LLGVKESRIAVAVAVAVASAMAVPETTAAARVEMGEEFVRPAAQRP